jgi:hypothetical protein
MRSMTQLDGWEVRFENVRVLFEEKTKLIPKVKRDIL